MHGFLPIRIAFPVLASILCGRVWLFLIVESFIDYVGVHESSILRQAISEANFFSEKLQSELIALLSRFGCRGFSTTLIRILETSNSLSWILRLCRRFCNRITSIHPQQCLCCSCLTNKEKRRIDAQDRSNSLHQRVSCPIDFSRLKLGMSFSRGGSNVANWTDIEFWINYCNAMPLCMMM